MNRYLSVLPEVQKALDEGRPVVALESTILSHGMPWPQNLQFGHDVEKLIREEGAVPATIAILDGQLKVGLTDAELERMCRAEDVGKVSRRDVPVYLAAGKAGATTVATTMLIAEMAGIPVFATGGIGGVHRGAETTMDISADLQELAHTSVAVVSAGVKSILDIGLTLEYLETMGVPVWGMGTQDFPAFYCRKSGFSVDYALQDEAEAARVMQAKWGAGLKGGLIIANPVPEEYAMDSDQMAKIIDEAIAESREKGIKGKKITPFLLARIVELTGGESLNTNIQLAFHNARCAARIAKAYAAL